MVQAQGDIHYNPDLLTAKDQYQQAENLVREFKDEQLSWKDNHWELDGSVRATAAPNSSSNCSRASLHPQKYIKFVMQQTNW
jgi:hypothetical protein